MTNDMYKERLTFIRNEWNARAKNMGKDLNSVLFKRCPVLLNRFIDRQHFNFINDNIGTSAIQLLDVGCGYGRLSRKIKNTYPASKVYGIDLSECFIEIYNRDVGPASCVALEDFESQKKYNLIFVVTVLMYLEKEQLDKNIFKLWDALMSGGTMVVIESANEFQLFYRRLSRRHNAEATGGDVLYFSKKDLAGHLTLLPNLSCISYKSVQLIPFTNFIPIHHMYALRKSDDEII